MPFTGGRFQAQAEKKRAPYGAGPYGASEDQFPVREERTLVTNPSPGTKTRS